MSTVESPINDPVCGMSVDPKTALKAERDGKTSYFCSEKCRATFVASKPGTKPKGNNGGCCS